MRKPGVGVAAVAGGDFHACHKPPLARSAEPDWYEAMARPLREVRNLCREHQCPFLFAGDLFDDGWRQHKCPPELINFVIREFPDQTFAVPGNHDLPHHNYQDLRRSAFWTLEEAGKIKMLEPGTPYPLKTEGGHRIVLFGFPLGFPPKAKLWHSKVQEEEWLSIAVIHHYVWKDGHVHPGAKEEDHVRQLRKKLHGYKVAVFGDNHSGFTSLLADGKGTNVVNCGTMMRRRTDEADYRPRVALIYSDGSVKLHYLDTSKDVHETDPKLENVIDNSTDLSFFLEGLSGLTDKGLDFIDLVKRYAEDNAVGPGVRKILYDCLEGKK